MSDAESVDRQGVQPRPSVVLGFLWADLPDQPLTENDLAALVDEDTLGAVYVPIDRPDSIPSLADDVDGDILTFWVECEQKYFQYTFTATDGGQRMGWYHTEAVPFDDGLAGRLEIDLRTEYHRLGGTNP